MQHRLSPISRILKQLLACCVVVLLLSTSIAQAIEVIADTSSGEVFLRNPSAVIESIDGYQIDSLSGSLLPGNLGGITGVSDMSGDMSLDMDSDWFVITSTTNAIVEASLEELSGTIGPGEAVSLGVLWDLNASQDLTALISAGMTVSVTPVQYIDLTADYNSSGFVDVIDYVEFFLNYGSTTDLDADGNGDGIVDAADFTIWRDAFEIASQPILDTSAFSYSSTSTFSFASAVPEPNSLALLCFACSMTISKRKR